VAALTAEPQALSPLDPSSGSMKWFMPPMCRRASRMQADTHEPSTVQTFSPWVVT
jgi:hypothetical protein